MIRVDAAARGQELGRQAKQVIVPFLASIIRGIPAGAWRTFRAVVAWCSDPGYRERRDALSGTICALQSRDPGVQERRAKLQDRLDKENADHRVGVVLRCCVVAMVTYLLVTRWGPYTDRYGISIFTEILVAVAAVAAVGWVGRNPETKTVVSGPAALTDDNVRKAFRKAGIPELRKAIEQQPGSLGVVESKTRVNGVGWEMTLSLPDGVIAKEVIRAGDTIAANLRRPAECVHLTADPTRHDGIVCLLVTDRPVSEQKQPAWPYLDTGVIDLGRDEVTVGYDPRLRPVNLNLWNARMIIGAVPNAGKTFTARLIALAGCLDPSCEVLIFEGGGTGEFGPLSPRAQVFSGGDDQTIREFLEALRAARERVDELMARVSESGTPESKLTPDMVSPDFGGPFMLVMDELQIAFSHPEFGGEIKREVHDWITETRKGGTIFVGATHEPNSDAIPPATKRMCSIRVCHRTNEQRTNDAVLGDGAHRDGLTTTAFHPEDDKGLAHFKSSGDIRPYVQVSYLDRDDAQRIVWRAVSARRDTGWDIESGHGDDDEDTDTFRGHLIEVWPTGQDGQPVRAVSYKMLHQLLSERWPTQYRDESHVQAQAKSHGLEQVRSGLDIQDNGTRKYNKRGIPWLAVSPSPGTNRVAI